MIIFYRYFTLLLCFVGFARSSIRITGRFREYAIKLRTSYRIHFVLYARLSTRHTTIHVNNINTNSMNFIRILQNSTQDIVTFIAHFELPGFLVTR